jgi:sulfur-carrier protein
MKIILPQVLAKLTDNNPEIVCSASTIDGMLSDLKTHYPLLVERLVDKNGNINKFLNVFINEDDIRFLKGQQSFVGTNDVVSFVPMIAGG